MYATCDTGKGPVAAPLAPLQFFGWDVDRLQHATPGFENTKGVDPLEVPFNSSTLVCGPARSGGHVQMNALASFLI